VALQRKSVKPAGNARAMKSIRKCLGIVKEFTPDEGALGGQTLYMTGRMQNDRKRAIAIRQALD
jgi:hypothetical protein